MMSDILEELVQARPVELDRAAPGWNLRREQLLAELDDRVTADPQPDRRSNSRRRALLMAAAAAAVAIVVIVGASIQTGQRVQPDPARVVSATAVDPTRPVHAVGPGEYFLRRTSSTLDVGQGEQTYQRAAWFDDQGQMWTLSAAPDGATTATGPLGKQDAANPLSFMTGLSEDPATAQRVLEKRQPGVVDSIQQAADANLSPAQYVTLQQVLLRLKGAARLPDGADTLSRPAVVVEAPGRAGTTVRFYFDPSTAEILEVRSYAGQGQHGELGRSVLVGDVRSAQPSPPFDPVVPAASVPATEQMNRPLSAGQYLRRSVIVEGPDGVKSDGTQWVDAGQRRWLGVGGALSGSDEVPAPAGLSSQQYLAAMPDQVDQVERWFDKGLGSCGECLLARADALMLANLNQAQRQSVIAAIARQEDATDEPITDSMGRAARELRLPAEVDGRTVEHLYRYDPVTSELLEWGSWDPDGKPTGITWLTFLGSEVTTDPPA